MWALRVSIVSAIPEPEIAATMLPINSSKDTPRPIESGRRNFLSRYLAWLHKILSIHQLSYPMDPEYSTLIGMLDDGRLLLVNINEPRKRRNAEWAQVDLVAEMN